MRRARAWLLATAILVVVAMFVAGRATQMPIAPNPTPGVSLPTVRPVVSPSPESSSNPEAQSAVDAAMRDAAGRLSLAIGAGDIRVQQVTPREWPDSSLGCPRQGEMYSQIVTPGYLVMISAAGKQLEYHADSRGHIVLCQES